LTVRTGHQGDDSEKVGGSLTASIDLGALEVAEVGHAAAQLEQIHARRGGHCLLISNGSNYLL
jgi:hypothetical protein